MSSACLVASISAEEKCGNKREAALPTLVRETLAEETAPVQSSPDATTGMTEATGEAEEHGEPTKRATNCALRPTQTAGRPDSERGDQELAICTNKKKARAQTTKYCYATISQLGAKPLLC